jgi:hypothetical protein
MVELIVTETTVAEMATPPSPYHYRRSHEPLRLSLRQGIAIAISTTRILVRIALTPYKLDCLHFIDHCEQTVRGDLSASNPPHRF